MSNLHNISIEKGSSKTIRKSIDFVDKINRDESFRLKKFNLPDISSKYSDLSKRDSICSDHKYRSFNLYVQFKKNGEKDSIDLKNPEKISSLKPNISRIIKTTSLQKID